MDPPFIKLYPDQRHGSKSSSDSSDGFSLQGSLSEVSDWVKLFRYIAD